MKHFKGVIVHYTVTLLVETSNISQLLRISVSVASNGFVTLSSD